VALTNLTTIRLNYGQQGCFECEIDARRVVSSPEVPGPLADVGREVRSALGAPLDFPPFEQALVPGDHVVLALDRDTPEAAVLIRETWDVLSRQGVTPENVIVLQPASLSGRSQSDPLFELPEQIRNSITWTLHDPTDSERCAYLASTTSGERIHLAQEITNADVVVTIGSVTYDPLMGYRGTNSVFYPGLSNVDAVERSHGQGHRELGPDDDRLLRQMIDEIGWMIGNQFTIQVIASAGDRVSHVLAGAADSVLRRGKQLLAEHWLIEVDEHPDVVVAAVDCDAAGHGWEQIGAALTTARNLVAGGGKIVILSELSAKLGQGLELVRECDTARDAIQPLRTFLPPDLVPATQLADAVDWADVYLLSALEGHVVEDLFMVPLDDPDDVSRLLRGEKTCLFLGSAQHTFGQTRIE
jgi:nickel-dependent lactate racemase